MSRPEVPVIYYKEQVPVTVKGKGKQKSVSTEDGSQLADKLGGIRVAQPL